MGAWECRRCTFQNEPGASRCSMCDLPAPPPAFDPKSPAFGEWFCWACTLRNPPGTKRCAVCECDREPPTPLDASALLSEIDIFLQHTIIPAWETIGRLTEQAGKIRLSLEKAEAKAALSPEEWDAAFGRIHELRERLGQLFGLAFRAGAWDEGLLSSARDQLQELEDPVVETLVCQVLRAEACSRSGSLAAERAAQYVAQCQEVAGRLQGFNAAEDLMRLPRRNPKSPLPSGRHPKLDPGSECFVTWWLRYRNYLIDVRNYLASLVGLRPIAAGPDFGLTRTVDAVAAAQFAVGPIQFRVPPATPRGEDDEGKEVLPQGHGPVDNNPPPIFVGDDSDLDETDTEEDAAADWNKPAEAAKPPPQAVQIHVPDVSAGGLKEQAALNEFADAFTAILRNGYRLLRQWVDPDSKNVRNSASLALQTRTVAVRHDRLLANFVRANLQARACAEILLRVLGVDPEGEQLRTILRWQMQVPKTPVWDLRKFLAQDLELASAELDGLVMDQVKQILRQCASNSAADASQAERLPSPLLSSRHLEAETASTSAAGDFTSRGAVVHLGLLRNAWAGANLQLGLARIHHARRLAELEQQRLCSGWFGRPAAPARDIQELRTRLDTLQAQLQTARNRAVAYLSKVGQGLESMPPVLQRAASVLRLLPDTAWNTGLVDTSRFFDDYDSRVQLDQGPAAAGRHRLAYAATWNNMPRLLHVYNLADAASRDAFCRICELLQDLLRSELLQQQQRGVVPDPAIAWQTLGRSLLLPERIVLAPRLDSRPVPPDARLNLVALDFCQTALFGRSLQPHLGNSTATANDLGDPTAITDGPLYPSTQRLDALSPPPPEPLSELQLRDLARQVVASLGRIHAAGWAYGGQLQLPGAARLSHLCSTDPTATAPAAAGLSVFSLAELEGLLGDTALSQLQDTLAKQFEEGPEAPAAPKEPKKTPPADGFQAPEAPRPAVSWAALLSSPSRFNQLSRSFADLDDMQRPRLWSGAYLGEFVARYPGPQAGGGAAGDRPPATPFQVLVQAETLTGVSRVARPGALPLLLLAELGEARKDVSPQSGNADGFSPDAPELRLLELQQRDLLELCRLLCQLFFPDFDSERLVAAGQLPPVRGRPGPADDTEASDDDDLSDLETSDDESDWLQPQADWDTARRVRKQFGGRPGLSAELQAAARGLLQTVHAHATAAHPDFDSSRFLETLLSHPVLACDQLPSADAGTLDRRAQLFSAVLAAYRAHRRLPLLHRQDSEEEAQGRNPHRPRIKIRRSHLVDDLAARFGKQDPQSASDLWKHFTVQYTDFIGADQGGLTEDLFTEYFLQVVQYENWVFDSPAGEAARADDPSLAYIPCPKPESARSNHLNGLRSLYLATGRLMAKSLLEQRYLSVRFPVSVYAFLLDEHLLVRRPGLLELADYDPERARALSTMVAGLLVSGSAAPLSVVAAPAQRPVAVAESAEAPVDSAASTTTTVTTTEGGWTLALEGNGRAELRQADEAAELEELEFTEFRARGARFRASVKQSSSSVVSTPASASARPESVQSGFVQAQANSLGEWLQLSVWNHLYGGGRLWGLQLMRAGFQDVFRELASVAGPEPPNQRQRRRDRAQKLVRRRARWQQDQEAEARRRREHERLGGAAEPRRPQLPRAGFGDFGGDGDYPAFAEEYSSGSDEAEDYFGGAVRAPLMRQASADADERLRVVDRYLHELAHLRRAGRGGAGPDGLLGDLPGDMPQLQWPRGSGGGGGARIPAAPIPQPQGDIAASAEPGAPPPYSAAPVENIAAAASRADRPGRPPAAEAFQPHPEPQSWSQFLLQSQPECPVLPPEIACGALDLQAPGRLSPLVAHEPVFQRQLLVLLASGSRAFQRLVTLRRRVLPPRDPGNANGNDVGRLVDPRSLLTARDLQARLHSPGSLTAEAVCGELRFRGFPAASPTPRLLLATLREFGDNSPYLRRFLRLICAQTSVPSRRRYAGVHPRGRYNVHDPAPGSSFHPPLTVQMVRDMDRLPVGHSCTHVLDFPDYQDAETLRLKLITALDNVDHTGFDYV